MKKFLADFKAFALKGNIIDMAVGVIIGTSFTAIVNSLVKDVLMPLLGLVTGGFDVTGLVLKINEDPEAAQLTYGVFLQNIINFVLIALSLFVFIRIMGKLHRKKEEAPPAPPKKSDEVLLLEEISASLKKMSEEKERV